MNTGDTKVRVAEAKASNIHCQKGQLHNSQCISMVCVEPGCKNDPLACCICFVTTHKNHSVMPLTKLIYQYETRNANSETANILQQFIWKEQKYILEDFLKFRKTLEEKLDQFEDFIKNNSVHMLNDQMTSIKESCLKTQYSNLADLEGVVDRILNKSVIDSDRVVGLTRKNELLVRACVDKMANSVSHCIRNMLTSASLFQDIQYNFCTAALAISSQKSSRQSLHKNPQLLTEDHSILQQIPFQFGIHHHNQLRVNRSSVCSNVSALKPQFALLTPHLQAVPIEVKEWAIKINQCRDFATKNTLGIGVITVDEAKEANFQGQCKSMILVTSQGYVEGSVNENCGFIFMEGDTVNCKYDPFYHTFQLSKNNGRVVVFNTKHLKKPLCACVRLTYATDFVEIK